MEDSETEKNLQRIPLLKTNAGPRDKANWVERLKEEYTSLIQFIECNKKEDKDWFRIEANSAGTKWFGKCWYIYEHNKYEFDFNFDIPATYPQGNPEIALPELDGKTAKMYRGGKICLTDHFKPIWMKNCPHFGIAHAMAMGLGPWLSVEIPDLVNKGIIKHSND
ncbi:Ubiquitin-fold modifier-conjugating enzyme 1 [Cichlidogyrus casuarinus]|uniref:Ubiquitin-fold modifier-conjugating enzyme 1 n=1 Tax=Cichlidogyrus casuarinus TaxID=1844966 RepID=A0ABD2Q9Q8_9PLAT